MTKSLEELETIYDKANIVAAAAFRNAQTYDAYIAAHDAAKAAGKEVKEARAKLNEIKG